MLGIDVEGRLQLATIIIKKKIFLYCFYLLPPYFLIVQIHPCLLHINEFFSRNMPPRNIVSMY